MKNDSQIYLTEFLITYIYTSDRKWASIKHSKDFRSAGGVKPVQAWLLCNRCGHDLPIHVMRHNFRLKFSSLWRAHMCVIANKLVKNLWVFFKEKLHRALICIHMLVFKKSVVHREENGEGKRLNIDQEGKKNWVKVIVCHLLTGLGAVG